VGLALVLIPTAVTILIVVLSWFTGIGWAFAGLLIGLTFLVTAFLAGGALYTRTRPKRGH
jgi:hypothetical protein